MIRQNPFSLYDFLGYFIPGAITLYIILLTLRWGEMSSINDIVKIINDNKEFKIDQALFFVITSYSIGHFISYLSSITIETYGNWKYGYPSKYLLGLTDNLVYFPENASRRNILFRLILVILILPVPLLDVVFGEWLLFKKIFARKLDGFLIRVIESKKAALFSMLYKNGVAEHHEQGDFHRIISHYVYENSKMHQSKMTNYVALYGFLRALSLICCFIFWILLIYSINTVYSYHQVNQFQLAVATEDINFNLLVLLSAFFFGSYIYFMGFMKFYRRYTLEGYMVMAIDREIVNKKDPQSIITEESE